MKSVITAAAAALVALSAAPSFAATAIYTTANSTGGNQSYPGTLGLNFDVSSSVTVTQFGAFDSGKDGITTNINVAIFDRNTGLIISPTVNFLGTANAAGNAYVFKTVTPFVLAAGNYQLGAWNYNSTDMNFNTFGNNPGPIVFNNLGGNLTALTAAYSFSSGNLATITDPGLTRYGAGTFAVAVPEPATWGLMIAGFAMTGFAMRRRAAVVA